MEKDLEEQKYAGVYQELYQLLDEKTVLVMWQYFRGTTISFPQKLYDSEYVRTCIAENRNNMTTAGMASRFGLSERRIRQIAAEIEAQNRW